jgi:nitrite reductase (NADH) large subunit
MGFFLAPNAVSAGDPEVAGTGETDILAVHDRGGGRAAPPASGPDPEAVPVVVVGSGPVGIQCARLLRAQLPELPVVVYGDEPWQPYDRVQLSALLGGQRRLEQVIAPPVAGPGCELRLHCRVTAIEPQAHRLRDAHGRVQAYRKLMLAVGAGPLVPRIPGIDSPGVHVLRDLGDVQRLLARQVRSRHTLVLGGGLLGLEAARAMQRAHTRVTLVHHGPWLANRQLDAGAAARLQDHLERLGLRVLVNAGVREVLGGVRLTGVRLGDGSELDCDTLVVATGIRPRVELARAAGLRVGRGIQVNDAMQSSDPDIYAVGDCVEHRGRVQGTLAPGFEQAGVAVHHLGGGRARYLRSVEASTLKVIDCPVFSVGRVGESEEPGLDRATCYADAGHYRRILTRAGRAVGAVAVGDWAERSRVCELVARGGMVWPWQRRRLRRTGNLWPSASQAVAGWPARAVVCQCRGVSRGRLGEALAAGAVDLDALIARTGAGTVCGGCRPLLCQLLEPGAAAADPGGRPGLAWTVAAAPPAVALVGILPDPGFSDSVRAYGWLERASTQSWCRQLSGYGLVAIAVAGLAMSVHKRTSWRRGNYERLRLWHGLSGLLALAALVVHTGLRPGANLNFWLLANFLAVVAAGALAGAAVAWERRLGARAGAVRRCSLWLHLSLLWPLPALLAAHVLAGYYF